MFERGVGHFERKFQGERASATNDFWHQNTRVPELSYGKKIAENFNRLSRVHQRYRQTTDRQTTDGRQIAYSEREREFTSAKNHMWPIEWPNYSRPFVTLKLTFAVWNLSISYTLGNTPVHQCVYIWNGKRMWLVISTISFWIWRTSNIWSQPVQCKCCNISETVPERVVVTTDH